MNFTCRCASLFAVFAAAVPAAGPASPSVAQTFDQQLTRLEKEFVPLVDAMPPEKFGFAPSEGAFQGVRTFSQQATHTAAVIYAVSAAALGEKNPSELGKSENGPASLNSKAAVLQYLKDAFAYGHRAMASLTQDNLTGLVPSAFGGGKVPRIAMANLAISHSFNHYGQMVVYARMNGIVPPASR
jgi:uncharacterized damage-inducible protein DinB